MGKTIYGWLLAASCFLSTAHAQSTVLYETKFEASEGFDRTRDLAGQRGWLIDGTGGNGLLDQWFPGFGQQAYVGFTPPTEGAVTTVWHPVGYNPPPSSNQIVRFSVTMEIVQSTAGGDDDFRWSVYNNAGNRLFGISFETATGQIWFQNEDLQFRPTDWTFDFGGTYDFEIWMDFARNSWTARLNDLVLANAQPISTTNTARNLGDVDAVWFINNTAGVGNNFMVFDDYRVTAENIPAIPAFLEALGRTTEGFYRFYVHGQKGVRYGIEYSTDLHTWVPHGEFQNDVGTFLFEDNETGSDRYRFYKVREIQ